MPGDFNESYTMMMARLICSGGGEGFCQNVDAFLSISGNNPQPSLNINGGSGSHQVNYVLLNLHLAGKHDAKPTHEELRDWLHSRQVDVLRMSAK
jgi:hypothetical protein